MLERTRAFRRHFACTVLTCCLALPAAAAPAPRAEGRPKSNSAARMTEDEMMAETLRLGTPGPNHELLKHFVGSWKTVTRAWLGPGDPQVTEGTATYASILGGRFIEQEFQGTFMGQPFEGFGLTGYDNKKGRFVMIWSDVMITSALTAEGTYDPATQEWSFKGVMDLVGPRIPYRMVIKLVDDNRHVVTMHETRDGKEVLSMEITYTRS